MPFRLRLTVRRASPLRAAAAVLLGALIAGLISTRTNTTALGRAARITIDHAEPTRHLDRHDQPRDADARDDVSHWRPHRKRPPSYSHHATASMTACGVSPNARSATATVGPRSLPST